MGFHVIFGVSPFYAPIHWDFRILLALTKSFQLPLSHRYSPLLPPPQHGPPRHWHARDVSLHPTTVLTVSEAYHIHPMLYPTPSWTQANQQASLLHGHNVNIYPVPRLTACQQTHQRLTVCVADTVTESTYL